MVLWAREAKQWVGYAPVWCALVGILNSGSQLMILWDGSCLTLACSSIVEITTLVLTLMAVRGLCGRLLGEENGISNTTNKFNGSITRDLVG